MQCALQAGIARERFLGVKIVDTRMIISDYRKKIEPYSLYIDRVWLLHVECNNSMFRFLCHYCEWHIFYKERHDYRSDLKTALNCFPSRGASFDVILVYFGALFWRNYLKLVKTFISLEDSGIAVFRTILTGEAWWHEIMYVNWLYKKLHVVYGNLASSGQYSLIFARRISHKLCKVSARSAVSVST